MKYILHSILVLGLCLNSEITNTRNATVSRVAPGGGGSGGGTSNANVKNNSNVALMANSTSIPANGNGTVTYTTGSNISFTATNYVTTAIAGAATITVTGSAGSDLSINGTTMKYSTVPSGNATEIPVWSQAGTITLVKTTSSTTAIVQNDQGQKFNLTIGEPDPTAQYAVSAADLNALGLTGPAAVLVPAS